MNKIKIGQIGVCHEHAEGKIRTLRLLPDLFEIVGIVDDRDSKSAKIAGKNLTSYDGLNWISEEKLFNTPGLQAVTVEVPNLDLVSTAFRCLERGLPIHMDKPGGDELTNFAKLRKEYSDRNLPFQMGYMVRSNPAMQWVRDAISKGWLGEIFEIQASMSHDYGDEEYQKYIGKFNGGIMFNLGCHFIDFVISILGRPSEVVPFLKSAPNDPKQIKNNCVAILAYPHATATLRACSREVEGLSRRRLKICGTKGSIELCPLERFDGEPLTMELILKEDIIEYTAGKHILNFGIIRDRYESQLKELALMIQGKIKNPYNYQHDCLVQEVILAASGYTKFQP